MKQLSGNTKPRRARKTGAGRWATRAVCGALVAAALSAPVRAENAPDTSRLSLAPVAAFDPNINGGMPGESFDLAGLRFSVPQDHVAKAGPLIGAGLSLAGMTDLGANLGVDYSASAQFLTDLKSGLDVRTAAASVCGLMFLTEETLGSLCALTSREEKALSQTATTGLELSFDHRKPVVLHAVAVAGWQTSVGGLLGREKLDGAWRSKIGGSLGLYGGAGRSATMAVTVYEPLKHQLSDRYRLSFDVKRPGHTLAGFGISYVRSEGGNFFGLARQDDMVRVSVDVPLGSRVMASLGVTRKDSTVDFYDAGGDVDIRFTVLDRQP